MVTEEHGRGKKRGKQVIRFRNTQVLAKPIKIKAEKSSGRAPNSD
jgi:hypothetical protein